MKQSFIGLLLIITLSWIPPADAAEEFLKATIAEAYIELHTGPGRGYPVFYIAERGEQVELLMQRTGWVKVKTGGDKQGWVPLASIAKTLSDDGQTIAVNNPQLEQFSNRKWEMGFMAGDFGGTDVISGYTGYHFTRNLSLELTVSENFGNFSSGQSAVISILHQPFPEWRYSPFISLGGGMRKTDPRSTVVETEDRKDDLLVVGAGIRIYLSNQFMLRLQYNNHTVLTNRDNDIEVEEWKIGLSAFF